MRNQTNATKSAAPKLYHYFTVYICKYTITAYTEYWQTRNNLIFRLPKSCVLLKAGKLQTTQNPVVSVALPLLYTARRTCTYRVGQKPDQFWKFVAPVYDDKDIRSIHEITQCFIQSMTGALNFTKFKYSLLSFSETIHTPKWHVI